jgi:hypothetical protein
MTRAAVKLVRLVLLDMAVPPLAHRPVTQSVDYAIKAPHIAIQMTKLVARHVALVEQEWVLHMHAQLALTQSARIVKEVSHIV